MAADHDRLEREFAEYARLAKLRIPFVANGYSHALEAYRQERQNPTPLMRQAAENVRTSGVGGPLAGQRGVHVECCECHNCGHIGINDSHPTDSSCSECDWTGPSPKEDHCPGCGKDGTMHLACPKCSARYHTIAETTVGVNPSHGAKP